MKDKRSFLFSLWTSLLVALLVALPAFAAPVTEEPLPSTGSFAETETQPETEEVKSEYTLSVTVENEDPNVGTVEIRHGEKIGESGMPLSIPPTVTVTLAAKPAEGYALKEWVTLSTSFELPDDKLNAETVSFSMPKSDVQIIAVFEPVKVYSLTVDRDDIGGTTYIVSEKDSYRAGETVRIDAMPYDGFVFSHWVESCDRFELEDDQKRASKLEFVMPAEDVTLTPKFEAIVYYFTVKVQGLGEVEIMDKEPLENGKYECTVGEEIPVSAIPGVDCEFINWSVTGGAELEQFDSADTTLICPASDFTVTANFASSVMELTVVAGEGGNVTPEGTLRLGVDNIFNLIASPNPGFVFAGWECTSEKGSFEDPKSATTRFTMPDQNCTVTATFRKGGYKLSIKTSAGGTVEGAEGTYEMGNEVSLVAVPMKGYVFSHWESDVKDVLTFPDQAETEVIVPGRDVQITAVFVLNTVVVPATGIPTLPDEEGFPWLGLTVVFLLSALVITVVAAREKNNLSFQYLIRKFFTRKRF